MKAISQRLRYWFWYNFLKPKIRPNAGEKTWNERISDRLDKEVEEVLDRYETKNKNTMKKIAISSGHGLHIRGASGFIDEVDEARRVVDRVCDLINMSGNNSVHFHDDVSRSSGDNLRAIVNWHNEQDRDIDVSVHFNSVEQPSANGVETICRDISNQELAHKMSNAIAGASGMNVRASQGGATLRGVQFRTNLFVVNGLQSKPMIMLEVCFVSNKRDSELYNENFEAICNAIAHTLISE